MRQLLSELHFECRGRRQHIPLPCSTQKQVPTTYCVSTGCNSCCGHHYAMDSGAPLHDQKGGRARTTASGSLRLSRPNAQASSACAANLPNMTRPYLLFGEHNRFFQCVLSSVLGVGVEKSSRRRKAGPLFDDVRSHVSSQRSDGYRCTSETNIVVQIIGLPFTTNHAGPGHA